MCGDCFVCIYLVCQCDGLELGRRNRRITVRGVAVRINTGAFMQAEIDELVHVRLTGAMVTLLLEIDYDMYKEYVVIEKGERVMYMELLKALYGTLRAA